MRKLMMLFAAILLGGAGAMAQRTELCRAAERYRDVKTLTADVRQTRHRTALAKDAVSQGRFYFKRPDSESMVFRDSREMLLAVNNTYVMVRGGKRHVAKADGKGGNPFAILHEAFRRLIAGEETGRLSDAAEVKLKKQGSACLLTVTPTPVKGKKTKRMMYTSCVATIDLKTAELRTLRINEPGGNYTQYDFSHYVFNAEVSQGMFDTRTVMGKAK